MRLLLPIVLSPEREEKQSVRGAGAHPGKTGPRVRLVQITLNCVNDDLRLRRLTCGKASPFRRTGVLSNFFHAGWKAEPSSRHGRGAWLRHWPESRRLSASRGGGAALGNNVERLIWTGQA